MIPYNAPLNKMREENLNQNISNIPGAIRLCFKKMSKYIGIEKGASKIPGAGSP